MVKCTFCNTEIEKGTGKIFVYTSGKLANFCSMKCEKNLIKLGRKPRNITWALKEKKVKK
jgi:large subunit ribosomal protein L24e